MVIRLIEELSFNALPALQSVYYDGWLLRFARLNRIDDQRANTLGLLLALIVPQIICATVMQDGRAVAVGLGVLERGWLGIFDVVVDERVRNQGVGMRLMRGLLAWGKVNNAHHAYLQVVRGNAPALRLYEKLGFQESYTYWYRVKSL